MNIRDRFREESCNNLKITNVQTIEELEEALLIEISNTFYSGKASKLASLNRRYNQICLRLMNKNLSQYIAELVDKNKLFVLTNTKRCSRVVPADDWIEAYELAREHGDAAVERLNNTYLEG